MINSRISVGIINVAGGNINSLYAAIDKKKFKVDEIGDLNSEKKI